MRGSPGSSGSGKTCPCLPLAGEGKRPPPPHAASTPANRQIKNHTRVLLRLQPSDRAWGRNGRPRRGRRSEAPGRRARPSAQAAARAAFCRQTADDCARTHPQNRSLPLYLSPEHTRLAPLTRFPLAFPASLLRCGRPLKRRHRHRVPPFLLSFSRKSKLPSDRRAVSARPHPDRPRDAVPPLIRKRAYGAAADGVRDDGDGATRVSSW